MGNVGGTPRHYQGRAPESQGYAWTCKGCGTENLTPFEKGCQSCGLGKPEPAGVRVAQGVVVKPERLQEAVLEPLSDNALVVRHGVALQTLTTQARQTLALALALYAEHGPTPSNEELPRVITLAWARTIQAALNEETDGARGPEETT